MRPTDAAATRPAVEAAQEPDAARVRLVRPPLVLERGRPLGRDRVGDLDERPQLVLRGGVDLVDLDPARAGHAQIESGVARSAERLRDLVGDHREAVGRHRRGDAQDHVVGAGGEERPRRVERLAPRVRRDAARQLRGKGEVRGIATGGREGPGDLVALEREVVDVAGPVAGHRPALRVARGQRDAAGLLAAQPDRGAAGAYRAWLVGRAVERVERVVERDARRAGARRRRTARSAPAASSRIGRTARGSAAAGSRTPRARPRASPRRARG